MAFVRPWEDKKESFENVTASEHSRSSSDMFHGLVDPHFYSNISTESFRTHYIPDYYWFNQSEEHYQTKLCDLTPSSSDYSSEDTTSPSRRYSPYQNRNKHNRLLNKESINLMTAWYDNNVNNPYLTQQEAINLSTKCQLTVEQVKKWMANKRMRNKNTKQHKRRKIKTI